MAISPKLTGPRSPSWSFILLDHNENDLLLLDGVTSSSGEIAPRERLGGSASISIDDRGQSIDWMTNRIRFIYNPGIEGVAPWSMGVFRFSSPNLRRSAFNAHYNVKLLTKLSIPDSEVLLSPISLPAGTRIIPEVEDILRSTGETRLSVTYSDIELNTPYFAEVGTSKLTVINELLLAANYWALKVDLSGTFLIEPYVPPSDRLPVFTFEAGNNSIHRADWTHEQDLNSVPNVVACSTMGTDDEPSLIGIARNETTDPSSPAWPFSYSNRGYWVGRSYDVEASSQAVIDSIAQNYLQRAMDPVSKYSIEHAILPLQGDDAVIFQSTAAGREVHTRATVQRISWQGTFDAHMRTTLRANMSIENQDGD